MGGTSHQTLGERVDPRYLRSHEALAESILDLSRERPAEQLSVQEITRGAGISRPTFYRHADTPQQLLATVLAEDLGTVAGPLSAALQDPRMRFDEAWQAVYLEILKHVRRHWEIYRTMVAANSAAFPILVRRLEKTGRDMLQQLVSRSDYGQADPVWMEIAATQQGGNISSVIRTQVTMGKDVSSERIVDLFMTIAPPWQFAHHEPGGMVNLQSAGSKRLRGGNRS